MCGERWARDHRIRLLDAIEAGTGDVALVTVTGPGQDVIPWASTGERIADPETAAWWNASAPARWSQLHRRAQQAAAREARRQGERWCVEARVWELQKRGVLHLHLIVPFGTPAARSAARRYVQQLDRDRKWWGFGFVDKGQLRNEGGSVRTRRLRASSREGAARYLGGYLSSGEKGGGIRAVARSGTRPGSIVYVSHERTRQTGVTIRSLRQRRSVLARFPGADRSASGWAAACLAHAATLGRPPFDAAVGQTLTAAIAQAGAERLVNADTGQVVLPTRAAPPRALRAALSASQDRSGVDLVVRLDTVWHHDHTEGGPIGVSTLDLRVMMAPGASWPRARAPGAGPSRTRETFLRATESRAGS